jgi:hypothetical protein
MWEGAVVGKTTGDTAVVRVEHIGVQPIASLSTDARTFIADGLLCHNTHGDPGLLPIADILARAKGEPTTEEDPLAGMTKQDIYDAVWKTDQIAAPDTAPDRKTNVNWQPQSYLKDIGNRVRSLTVTVAAQSAAINALAAKVGTGVDTNTVVAAVEKAIADAVIKVDIDVTQNQES